MYIYQPDRSLLQKQAEGVKEFIKGRTLDVGSGTSERYSFRSQASEYIRMDVAPGSNVDVVGRAEAIPFPDDSFDSIVSTQVFEHVENPEQAAREVCRVLKKGGHLLITVPQWNELHEEPHDYWRYTRYGLQTLFERQGCALVRMTPRGGYFTVKAQMNARYAIDKYQLYTRPILGRIASRFFWIQGKWALWRDRLDTSKANHKHTLGWCAVFQKT